jgi:7-cyano-7-deazaguanine synthase
MVHPRVLAPLINYSKSDIVKIAVENSMPIDLVRSCYNLGEFHCGKCESCFHLKRALKANDCDEYIGLLFKNDEV